MKFRRYEQKLNLPDNILI